jgi:hypothetical protein
MGAIAWGVSAQQNGKTPVIQPIPDSFPQLLERILQESDSQFQSIRAEPLIGRDPLPTMHVFRWRVSINLPGARACEITQAEYRNEKGIPFPDQSHHNTYSCDMGITRPTQFAPAIEAALGPGWQSDVCDSSIMAAGQPPPICFHSVGATSQSTKVFVGNNSPNSSTEKTTSIVVFGAVPWMSRAVTGPYKPETGRSGGIANAIAATPDSQMLSTVGNSPAHAPTTTLAGVMTAYDFGAKTITVTPFGGKPVTLNIQDNISIMRLPPGETDPQKAIHIALSDVLLTDNLVAYLHAGVVSTVIVRTKERGRQIWEILSLAGTITNLDPDSREFTIKTRAGSELNQVVVQMSPGTDFRTFGPDSTTYADAKPSTSAALKIGDEVRVLGDSISERPLRAVEVISGTFHAFLASVMAVDVSGKKITIRDLDTHKTVEVRTNEASILRKLDPRLVAAWVYFLREGKPIPSRPSDATKWLEFQPRIAVSELKPGDGVVLTSTALSDGCVINLVAGIEQLITSNSIKGPRGGIGSQLAEFLGITGVPVPQIADDPTPSSSAVNSSLPIQLSRSNNPVGANPILTITNSSEYPWQISFSGVQTLAVSLMPRSSRTVTFVPGSYFISGSTSAQNVIAFAPGYYTFPQDVTGTFTITVR